MKKYLWETESMMKLSKEYLHKVILEQLGEMELYHGSKADFNEFDTAYISSGWGEQAYGYGFYLTKNLDVARDYARGGKIYTVEVPEGKYLSYRSISRKEAMRIAQLFFRYYTTEDEYGKEAYGSNPSEFWEMECKYIAECTDGGSVYGTVASLIGDDKAASEFFDRIGYVGLKWLDRNEATKQCSLNYVIFNPRNLKIVGKEDA